MNGHFSSGQSPKRVFVQQQQRRRVAADLVDDDDRMSSEVDSTEEVDGGSPGERFT